MLCDNFWQTFLEVCCREVAEMHGIGFWSKIAIKTKLWHSLSHKWYYRVLNWQLRKKAFWIVPFTSIIYKWSALELGHVAALQKDAIGCHVCGAHSMQTSAQACFLCMLHSDCCLDPTCIRDSPSIVVSDSRIKLRRKRMPLRIMSCTAYGCSSWSRNRCSDKM